MLTLNEIKDLSNGYKLCPALANANKDELIKELATLVLTYYNREYDAYDKIQNVDANEPKEVENFKNWYMTQDEII